MLSNFESLRNQNGKVSATLIFSILIIAVAAYVFFFEYKKGQKDEEKKEADAKVFSGFETDKVQSFTIAPNAMNHDFDIRVEKKDGKWSVLAPVNDVGDNDAIQSFLNSLTEEKIEESIAADQAGDLKTYGLDHPKGSVELNESSQKSRVDIGTIKTYDGRQYSLISTKPGVHVVSSVWGAYIDKKPNDFRNKKVERAQFHDWSEINTMLGQKPNLHLKKVDGDWESVPKSEIPLQTNLVEGFIFQMVNLEILDFISETKTDLAKHSLANPEIEVQLLGEENKKPHDFTLALSKKSPDGKPEHASATSSELSGVVEVYSAILDVAKRGTSYFFNRRFPFQYDPTQASKLRINMPELKLLAEKRDGKWSKVESSVQKELSSAQVDELSKALSRMETSSYLDEKGKGLSPARNEIEVLSAKGESLLKVVWGEEYKPKTVDPANTGIKFYYAQTSKTPKHVLSIKQTAIEDLALKSLFVEAKKEVH